MRTFGEGQYTSTPGKAILATRPRRRRGAAAPDWLVVSAWRPELAELEKTLPSLPPRIREKVALGTVGVGLVEAAIGASTLLTALRPKAMLLVGTAGLYPGSHGRLRVVSAAVARRITLFSQAASENAYLPPSMCRTQNTSSWLSAAIRTAARLESASVACPLAITATEAAAVLAARKSRSALENLEAFSVARAAARMKIPFAAVLGISNQVGDEGHQEWKRNAAEAAATACRAVVDYLSR
jgi:nucleoside phosphorylase